MRQPLIPDDKRSCVMRGEENLEYSPKRAVKISGKPLSRIRNQVIQNYPLYLAAKI